MLLLFDDILVLYCDDMKICCDDRIQRQNDFCFMNQRLAKGPWAEPVFNGQWAEPAST